jgi:hypothetical protein
LSLRNGEPDGTTIHEGQLSIVDVNKNASNKIWLYCYGDKGMLYLNEYFVAELDLSGHMDSGDIKVATGLFEGDEMDGYSTGFKEFTVWEIP